MRKSETPEIEIMIKEETNIQKINILLRLKGYNKEAHLYMEDFGNNWKTKYHQVFNKTFWKEARLLLREFFEVDGPITCSVCSKLVIGKSFTVHHKDFYPGTPGNMFTPLYVEIVHTKCHRKGDPRKWQENE